MDRLDRDEGLPRVYKIFSCEGKACCHMSAHEEDPTMPLFNPFGMSGHKRRVKMTPSKKIFWGWRDMWRLSGIFMMGRRP